VFPSLAAFGHILGRFIPKRPLTVTSNLSFVMECSPHPESFVMGTRSAGIYDTQRDVLRSVSVFTKFLKITVFF
jgi:hypothetical protein